MFRAAVCSARAAAGHVRRMRPRGQSRRGRAGRNVHRRTDVPDVDDLSSRLLPGGGAHVARRHHLAMPDGLRLSRARSVRRDDSAAPGLSGFGCSGVSVATPRTAARCDDDRIEMTTGDDSVADGRLTVALGSPSQPDSSACWAADSAVTAAGGSSFRAPPGQPSVVVDHMDRASPQLICSHSAFSVMMHTRVLQTGQSTTTHPRGGRWHRGIDARATRSLSVTESNHSAMKVRVESIRPDTRIWGRR